MPRARGEVGNPAGTCRSRASWRGRLAGWALLRCLPALQVSGLAARPRAGRGGGRRAGEPARVAESVDPARPRLGAQERRAGPGGASLSVNAPLLSAPPAAWRPALRHGSPRPRARRLLARARTAAGCGGSHGEPHATDGWTQARRGGTCVPLLGPSTESPHGCPPGPRGRSRSHAKPQVPCFPPCSIHSKNRSRTEVK